MRRFVQHPGAVGQSAVDPRLERDIGRVAALRQILVLDLLRLRLDGIPLRAVGREKDEMDCARRQVRRRRLDQPAVMHRIVFEHDHARARWGAGARHPLDEGQVRTSNLSKYGGGRRDRAVSENADASVLPADRGAATKAGALPSRCDICHSAGQW